MKSFKPIIPILGERAAPAIIALALSLAFAWSASMTPNALRLFLVAPRLALEFFLGAECLPEANGSILLPAHGSRLDRSCAGLGMLCVLECSVFLAGGMSAFGRKSRRGKGRVVAWSALYAFAFAATIVSNTFRIVLAHALKPFKEGFGLPGFFGHRLEGFIVMAFFGFLLIYSLIAVNERKIRHAREA